MNIKDLKYLVALADYGHFGKAADACFVSQPALSMQIAKLEESLGIKLLERTNKSVLLTDSGVIIVERVRQILNQIEKVRAIGLYWRANSSRQVLLDAMMGKIKTILGLSKGSNARFRSAACPPH